MTGEVLAPLRARYAHWLGLDERAVLADREEAAEDVRALQLLLRMERDRPPSWHAALALAARGSAALCLDPRAQEGGEWHDRVRDYCAGHIRKVTRRGRGAQWAATADVPGITLLDRGTEVRALVPGRVQDLDQRVSRLQVGGTDAPRDPVDVGPRTGSLRLWLAPGETMTLGKAMAQTGHAGMIAAALMAVNQQALHRWIDADLPTWADVPSREKWARLIAQLVDPEKAWREHRLLAVRDAGFTEVAPGTVTVIAMAPSGDDPVS